MLFMGCLAWRPIDEADLFYHLSLGRAVLAAHARIVPEPTAFRDFSEPAVASEWLWSVLSYVVFELGGARAQLARRAADGGCGLRRLASRACVFG